jgi:ribosome-binding ATPase
MSLQCGIVGLPNVGKSTLFNALTAAGADAANYPFCTIEPNVGIVTLRDERLNRISAIVKPARVMPTSVEFVDIAGLVKGASQGEGLGNQFLGNIRNVDAIIEVVRCFEDSDVVHVHGQIDPLRDLEVIHTELALADLDSVKRRMDKVVKIAKSGDKSARAQIDLLEKIQGSLDQGKMLRVEDLAGAAWDGLKDLNLLTAKPILYVANVSENDLKHPDLPAVKKLQELAAKDSAECVLISGKIESELAGLSEEERKDFLTDLGLKQSGLDRLAEAAYRLLGLKTFFTAGPKEVRAWTIPAGALAPQAAAVIHSDFEKHFIRAEVYSYDDLIAHQSEQAVREAGKLRVEGKDYAVHDGDIIHFRTSA